MPAAPTEILVPTELVGYWPLDAVNVDFSTRTAFDLSPSGNDGTLNGDWSPGQVAPGPGFGDGSLSFDGNSNITASAYPSLSQMSFCFWVRAPSPSTAVSAFSGVVSNVGTAFNWAFIWNFPSDPTSTQLFLMQAVSGNAGLQADFDFQDFYWYYVACTWDGSTMSVYVDGVLCGTLSQPDPLVFVGLGNFIIGGQQSGGLFPRTYFVGQISQVRVYTRAITPAEVLTLYQNPQGYSTTPLPPTSLQSLLNLITSEYNQQPNFMAMIEGVLAPIARDADLLATLSSYFDVDTAVGAQLDVLGQWVGQSRAISVDLTGIFFSWDTLGLGWDEGNWEDPHGGGSLVVLVDTDYRALLKVVVARNQWDGTTEGAYAAWAVAFQGTDTTISIQNFGNASIALILSGSALSAVTIAMFQAGLYDIVSAGVLVLARIVSGGPGVKFFAWDEETSLLGGWNEGSWTI